MREHRVWHNHSNFAFVLHIVHTSITHTEAFIFFFSLTLSLSHPTLFFIILCNHLKPSSMFSFSYSQSLLFPLFLVLTISPSPIEKVKFGVTKSGDKIMRQV